MGRSREQQDLLLVLCLSCQNTDLLLRRFFSCMYQWIKRIFSIPSSWALHVPAELTAAIKRKRERRERMKKVLLDNFMRKLGSKVRKTKRFLLLGGLTLASYQGEYKTGFREQNFLIMKKYTCIDIFFSMLLASVFRQFQL